MVENQIESSEFRFGSTKDKEPCVMCDFFRKEPNGNKVKVRTTIIAYIDAEKTDPWAYRGYRNGCKIIYTHGNDYVCSTLFPYLTQNAAYHCDMLIKKLAEELIHKVESDKRQLSINVEVR